jgi:hypothetical protein
MVLLIGGGNQIFFSNLTSATCINILTVEFLGREEIDLRDSKSYCFPPSAGDVYVFVCVLQ